MSGFDLGGAINASADWVCNAPVIRGIVSNPVFTALLITALVAVVVMALYHYQVKSAGTKKAVKAFLYVFLLVTAVMFVHHYAVMRSARDAAAQKGVRDVFSSIQQSRESSFGAAVPVVPMGWEATAAVADTGGVTGGATGGATGDVTGGGCGCPSATAGAPAQGPRPDNIALDSDIVIEDVVLPAAVSPFGK